MLPNSALDPTASDTRIDRSHKSANSRTVARRRPKPEGENWQAQTMSTSGVLWGNRPQLRTPGPPSSRTTSRGYVVNPGGGGHARAPSRSPSLDARGMWGCGGRVSGSHGTASGGYQTSRIHLAVVDPPKSACEKVCRR